jgi:sigma-B regulation protein RsbU (phosphoserine phosphatase)
MQREASVQETNPGSALQGAGFKALFRKLEQSLVEIEQVEDVAKMLSSILESLLARFEDELGFEGGRIYRREGADFILCCGFGASRNAPIGLRVPRDYPPQVRLLAEGILVMRRVEPGFDPQFEGLIGVSSTFAAITVGQGNSHIIAFSIRGEGREEQLLYSLTAVRHVINFKLQQHRMSEILEQARVVQEELLPGAPPAFPGYDIAARSRAAEVVGGDVYDFLPLAGDRLVVAIADSSGHGLPAALLARDVITGLRMATEGPFEITRVVGGLNRLIHRAALSSKFVTMFLSVLEPDGGLLYCNAGHNPPLLLRDDAFAELDRGGTVLGPLAAARFERAALTLEPGDTLALYTDGVVERTGDGGAAYGTERVRRLLLARRGAAETLDALFADLDAFGRGAPLADDITAIVVRKL